MSAFWWIITAMTALAMALVLLPLLGRSRHPDHDRAATNAAIFRERRAELAAEREAGRLDDAEYQQLLADAERTLLSDLPDETLQAAPASYGVGGLVWLLALLPVVTLGVYLLMSFRGPVAEWHAVLERYDSTLERSIGDAQLPADALEDPDGFARATLARALREGKNEPDTLFLLAQLYLQAEQAPPALTILQRIADIAPEYPGLQLSYAKGLLLAGSQAFAEGAYQEAIDVWQPVLNMQEPSSETAQMLRASIGEARRRLAATTSEATPDQSADQAPAARIAVQVDLAPELLDQLSPEDTLFVFARAAEGSPMPIAVIRQDADGFPVEVVLDDSRAMTPALKLSDIPRVVIGARVSKRGDAIPQPGDLQGFSPALTLAEEPSPSISLIIDEVVQ